MAATLTEIHRYPVKGLTAEALDHASLSAGQGIPQDRRFAIAHGASHFDPAHPSWQPKTQFLTLLANERLAALDARFDPDSGVLTLARDGREVARGQITTPVGCDLMAAFFAAYMGAEARGLPRLVEAPGHMFSDHRRKAVSIVSLTTLKDLERATRRPVDPRRMRGNLLVDGLEPWVELSWVGRTVSIGPARLRVIERIERCAAANVNPDTAERDLNIPKALMSAFDHIDCGVLAEVIGPGEIAVGDPVDAS